MEKREANASLMRHFKQFHLGALQAPARRQRAAVLATVGIAQHHPLAIAAHTQMGAIHRIVQQRPQRIGRVLQVVDGFKKRRDIERHVRISAIVILGGFDQFTVPGQRQHRQHIGGGARHADDVQADRIRAVMIA